MVANWNLGWLRPIVTRPGFNTSARLTPAQKSIRKLLVVVTVAAIPTLIEMGVVAFSCFVVHISPSDA